MVLLGYLWLRLFLSLVFVTISVVPCYLVRHLLAVNIKLILLVCFLSFLHFSLWILFVLQKNVLLFTHAHYNCNFVQEVHFHNVDIVFLVLTQLGFVIFVALWSVYTHPTCFHGPPVTFQEMDAQYRLTWFEGLPVLPSAGTSFIVCPDRLLPMVGYWVHWLLFSDGDVMNSEPFHAF